MQFVEHCQKILKLAADTGDPPEARWLAKAFIGQTDKLELMIRAYAEGNKDMVKWVRSEFEIKEGITIAYHHKGWFFCSVPSKESYNTKARNTAFCLASQGSRYELYWWIPSAKWCVVLVEPFASMPPHWTPNSNKMLTWEDVENFYDQTKQPWEPGFILDKNRLHLGFE